MRESLFRGKRKDNGEWIEGDLLHDRFIFPDEKICRIYNEESKLTHIQDIVIPETIGQYTGLNDNTKWEKLTKEEQLEWLKNHSVEEWNGKKIFEGDIVKNSCLLGKVVYATSQDGFDGIAGFMIDDVFDGLQNYNGFWHLVEVIGNIYDNPELLKVEEENA